MERQDMAWLHMIYPEDILYGANFMYQSDCIGKIISLGRPGAAAEIKGSMEYSGLGGMVYFYDIGGEVLVVASLYGLPYGEGCHQRAVLGMHIHEGESCTGNEKDPFADAGVHYDTAGCHHPYHKGDLPPVFVNHGTAWGAVVTDRFTLEEIKGKTVIIHQMSDDFMTQPSGNSGAKIACGVITIKLSS